MTPKEKAKELVEMFLALKKINPNTITRPYNWQEAKQCSLICIDEKIKTGIDLNGEMFSGFIEGLQEIKQEINKL